MSLNLSVSHEMLLQLVSTQLRSNFLLEPGEEEIIARRLPAVLERAAFCFSHSRNKYYSRDGETFFNPYHGGQYCIFLYFLSNLVWREEGASLLCDKIYGLNRMLHSVDLFYEVELPDIFFTDHPVGSVMGRAAYGRYFSFTQNCTVGNNRGSYPTIGENVRMMSSSRIIGTSRIGSNVIISSGAYIKDADIPDCSIVFGSSPHLFIKTKPLDYFALS